MSIINMRYSIDSVGGVEYVFSIKNNSDKEIKYITTSWDCYNAVGDKIYDGISLESDKVTTYTGPLAPGVTSEKLITENKFYNSSFKTIKWNYIIVEYMDGTKVNLADMWDFYYDISVTK